MTRRNRALGAACVLATSAIMLAAMIALWSRHAAHSAQAMGEQLEQLPAEELLPQLRRMTRLGNAALPAVCRALSSPRAEVADAAAAVLREELARWELLSARQASARLSLLAELLASEAGDVHEANREHRVALAMQILAWPETGLNDMPQIATACRAVLESARQEPSGPRLLAASHARAMPLPRVEAVPAKLETDESPKAVRLTESVEPQDLQEPNITTTAEPAVSKETNPPALLDVEPGGARPIESSAQPAGASARIITPQESEIKPAVRTQPQVPLAQLNTVPLAQLLHCSDAAIARAARAELVRRGHPAPEILIQEQLTDPDPAIRSRAVESLPQMPSMDARGWLLALSRDESADVRLVVLTMMATSGETRMLRRVQEMAQADGDPRVREQAQRVAR